jgi:predicted Zn-dependent protease
MQWSEMQQLKQQSRRLMLAGIGLFFLSACTVPQARIPPGTIPMAYVPSIEEEDQAEEIFIDLSEDYTLDVTSLQHDELQGMFNNLAAAANINPVNWKVHLFDDPEMVDVRAIRGNYLFVWSGVFDVVEDRDEIAGLLACEIAHSLARHNQPVEFSMATEMLFGVTDVAASIGLLVLSQGAGAVSGTGMSRWLYVEAADLDDLDRVYDAQQVQEMADIALQILARSEYSPEALLAFWKRAEADDEVQRRVKRLSRRISPAERVALLETAMQGMSLEKEQATEPDAGDELAALPMAAPM